MKKVGTRPTLIQVKHTTRLPEMQGVAINLHSLLNILTGISVILAEQAWSGLDFMQIRRTGPGPDDGYFQARGKTIT